MALVLSFVERGRACQVAAHITPGGNQDHAGRHMQLLASLPFARRASETTSASTGSCIMPQSLLLPGRMPCSPMFPLRACVSPETIRHAARGKRCLGWTTHCMARAEKFSALLGNSTHVSSGTGPQVRARASHRTAHSANGACRLCNWPSARHRPDRRAVGARCYHAVVVQKEEVPLPWYPGALLPCHLPGGEQRSHPGSIAHPAAAATRQTGTQPARPAVPHLCSDHQRRRPLAAARRSGAAQHPLVAV